MDGDSAFSSDASFWWVARPPLAARQQDLSSHRRPPIPSLETMSTWCTRTGTNTRRPKPMQGEFALAAERMGCGWSTRQRAGGGRFPSACRGRAVSMIAEHEKFLSDLNGTLPPPKFARDDRIFRSQLPEAIADVKAMISAADTGSQDAVLVATIAYVNDMIPTVTDALDDVDPSVAHAHN